MSHYVKSPIIYTVDCHDCRQRLIYGAQPEDRETYLTEHGWVHVGEGNWRCKACVEKGPRDDGRRNTP